MTLANLIPQENIVLDLGASTKKEALSKLSVLLAEKQNIPPYLVEEILTEREKLTSTAMGNGVALPHGRLKKLNQITCVFAKNAPIDFDATDKQPVSLFFALLVPEEAGGDYLNLLSNIATHLKTPDFIEQLQKADSIESIEQIFAQK